MALATYTDLKAAVGDWLHRGDLAARAADFIALAEVRFNRALRLNAMEVIYTSNTGSNAASVAIPSDLIEVKRFSVTANGREHPLEYATGIDLARASGETGVPRLYTGQGNSYLLAPQTDGDYAYTIYYFARFAALSDANPTNWLLLNAPDVYLYGALLEASAYLIDDDRLPLWKQAFDNAVQALQAQDDRKDHPSAGMRVRSDGVTW